MPWPVVHFLEATYPTAAENVALDEALLVNAEEHGGPAVLRLWEPDRVAVVLGASCRMSENVNVENCRDHEVEIARRSSGGGTVVIGPGTLNFSVILPVDAAPELAGVETAQRFVLGRTLESIRRVGIDAEMKGSGDLTLSNRKFSGSAQRRLRRHLLVHASLLYNFPLDLIDRYTRMPPRRPEYRENRPHSDFVTNLPLGADQLKAAVRDAWLPTDSPVLPTVIPHATWQSLVLTKFSEIGWIERL